MKKLITAVTVAALLASSVVPSALASGGHRHHGIGYGTGYYSGYGYGHRPYYGYRYRRHGGYWPSYRHRPPGHYRPWRYGHYRPWRYGRHRHYRHRHGGYYYYRSDGTVLLGVLAGAVVLGTLLSRPAPPPARPPVLRGPSNVPLGNCLRTTGTGTWYGRPAQFIGTMCYDPAGRAYVLPGSERFVGYLR